ncbi:polysaccharide biosynthesis tyrosine autokinase [Hydrogenophaga sp.]|uniref:polysaccharide biosynthesis tyrosine autokinase n=1 Tax=Hydrogenophaga sp. TaxID=1904254 RepID=UPI0026317F0E|nr:polysaccharide biosynthesis tyrosine autokinase [Hydrogenophaga sp.]MDM7948599.1 polysaccharide biosynthesis tyrosine autokinase [Hydrogenophaga sp.]
MNAPERAMPRGTIGEILIERGLIKPEDVKTILERQRIFEEPFGEAAIALKLLKRHDLDAALTKQFNYGYVLDADTRLDPALVTAFKPFSRTSEEFRALKSQLMLRWFNGDPRRRLLAVVSQRPRDGRSFVAANLAVVFAQQGQRTLLIDADLRKPRIATWFHTNHTAGLTGILSGRTGLEAVQGFSALPGLRVLPAGATPPNPQELVSMPAFGQTLDQVQEHFDVVLIDTPAVDGVSDAEIIAARAGAALIVVRKHRSPLRGVSDVAGRLQDTGVAVVGTMLNHY